MRISHKVSIGLAFFALVIAGCSHSEKKDPPPTYTITWKNWNGMTLETDTKVKKGTIPTYDGATPNRSNDSEYSYTWSGWNPEVVAATADKTYVATYSYEKIKTEYVLNFDLNGGTSVSYSGSKTVETFSVETFFFDCVKEGSNFRGWSYDGIQIFDEKGNQLTTPAMAKTMTFKAIYAENAKITIVSNFKDAGEISGEGEYPYNTNVDLSASAKKGYVFVGWYRQNELLSDKNEYKYMIWNEDVTFEARFKRDSYLMNAHSNNEKCGLVLLRSQANSDYLTTYQEYRDYLSEVTVVAYSKADARFLGWYDKSNQLVVTNAIYSFAMPNYDYELEAKWNFFTVSYNLNGGTNEHSNPVSYTIESSAIPLKAPSKAGYDFLGWEYKGSYVTEVDPSWSENVELNAIWRASVYSISYALNGGTNDLSNPTSYTIESNAIALRSASRPGYDFAGWYKTSDFSDETTSIGGGGYGDLTLYAKWTPILYSITYNLNGGTNDLSNPTSYTIESNAIILNGASRPSYDFAGWYKNAEFSGEAITNIGGGEYGNITLYAKWTPISYSITYNLMGGINDPSNPANYTVESGAIVLKNPSRLGYDFLGWEYKGSYVTEVDPSWSENVELTAAWQAIVYSIAYNLNGGTNDPSNPSSYTVEDAITFAAPTKVGYGFLGWFSDDNLVSSLPIGSTGNVDLEARWSPNLNNITVTSEDTNKGSVAITSGSGHSDESITVEATPKSDYVFKAWYHNGKKVSRSATYTFTMPTNDYSLVARFLTKAEAARIARYATEPTLSDDEKTVTYGLYPQKNVNDSATINALNLLSAPQSNGWYFYGGDYYAKLNAKPYKTSYKFDNGVTIVRDKTYWFKCEPIVWKVLQNKNEEYYVLSSLLLDAHCYYHSTSNRIIGVLTVHPNNYKESDIREWLNSDFFNVAFGLGNKDIQVTKVDNSSSTTDNSLNYYTCMNTEDKVFLPSYRDYADKNIANVSGMRSSTTTDWARARGAWYYDEGVHASSLYKGYHWARSPLSNNPNNAWIGTSSGSLDREAVNNASASVRPALTIKIP